MAMRYFRDAEKKKIARLDGENKALFSEFIL
jgi:hypothetical protein